jgi:GTP-binding protein
MKFIDEAEVAVQAGRGGPGARRFRREKFVPLGGPDGGNGGRGGSVIVRADGNKHTLLDFKFKKNLEAGSGASGGGTLSDGKAGEDLLVDLPIGTQIFNVETGELVADLAENNQTFVLAAGGRGGKGNAFFKSPTNQSPEHAQPGEAGQAGLFRLSLKLVADIGLIGFPNAGKSTLISRISNSRPKIADYPFTTLTPNLGVAGLSGGRSLVVADIPGLIPGAHAGKGLGIQFLKHIERTKVLAHLIDASQIDENGETVNALDSFHSINQELTLFSGELSRKKQVIVLTKLDTGINPEKIAELIKGFNALGLECLAISSVSGQGIEILLEHLFRLVDTSNRENG